MKRSNLRTAVFVITVFFVLFAICEAVIAEGVKLKMVYPGWDSKEQETAVTSMLREFEKQNPGITVEVISIPWSVMHQKLVVSLRSGNPPDLGYIIVRFLQEFQSGGFLADITDQVNTLNKSDWIQSTWGPATVNGRIYSVCDRVDPYMIFYNLDAFEKASIKAFPETTDDFISVGKQLTKDGKYAFGLVGAKHPTQLGQIMNFLYAFHGNFLSSDGKKSIINNQAGVEALTFYTDLLKKHKIVQPSAAADSRNEVRQLFMTGQVAMMIDGPWAQGTFRDMAPNLKWSVGKIPQVPGKARRSVLSAWYYSIFESCKHKEEAWKLVSFLLKPENQAKGVVTLPVQKAASKFPRFQTKEWAPWVDAAQYAAPEPSTEYLGDIADITGDAIQEIILDRKTPQQAADDAAARIDKAMK